MNAPDTVYRPIDIDFEVYRLIVLEKRGFDETANDALRRLLRLGAKAAAGAPSKPRQPSASAGASWRGKGVALPHGTKLRMEYRGAEHCGEVVDGRWEIAGKRYRTPSEAASDLARTGAGGKTSLNGWIYWRAKRPGDARWRLLKDLKRGEAPAANGAKAAFLRQVCEGEGGAHYG